MQEACEATQGGMAAIIGLDEGPCREACEAAGVTLANLNCPGQIVISGSSDRIPAAIEACKAKGARKAIALSVAGAYHSPLMDSARPRLASELASVRISDPVVPVISNVTAAPHGPAGTIASVLVDQVTSPVRWEASMRLLLSQGFTRFIEFGPGNALSGFLRRIEKTPEVLNVSDLPSLDATAKVLGA
jgi:[acyl-carrier-protein] S-malonyltransferase